MRTKIVAIIGIVITILLLGVLSYAYFSIDTNDNKNQEAVIETGTMRLKFVDNDTGFNGKLNFGESAEKLFIIENTGTLPAKAKINFIDMINTYAKGSLTYKLEYKTTEDGTTWIEVQGKKNIAHSSEAIDKLLASNLEIPVGAKYYYRLTVTLENLEDTDQTEDINAIFSTKFNLEDATNFNVGWLQQAVIDVSNNEIPANVNSGNPDFTVAATTDEGIYALEDDYGTSYYFRGASKNNYIKYGENKSGQDMWWRIIRINGDGSLRIIYDGTQGWANGVSDASRCAIQNQPWNSNDHDAKYVGWMFGGANGEASTSKEQAQTNETDSDAKVAVDTWYRENIVDTGYSSNVVDKIFCNDRRTDDYGFGEYSTFYKSSYDLLSGNQKFSCPEKNDAFTVGDTSLGNGKLTYPVGFLAANEARSTGQLAGDITDPYKYNTLSFLYKGIPYWTMTPSHSQTSEAPYTYVFNINNQGEITTYTSISHHAYSVGIAPVINLSVEYARALVGDGSRTNPYREVGVEP